MEVGNVEVPFAEITQNLIGLSHVPWNSGRAASRHRRMPQGFEGDPLICIGLDVLLKRP